MKRLKLVSGVVVFLLVVACVGGLSSCGEEEKNDDGIKETIYRLRTDDPITAPTLSLEDEDSSFTLTLDNECDYMPYGTYIEKDDEIVCKTDDKKYTFTFKIVDEDTLAYESKKSSRFPIAGKAPIRDGDEFSKIFLPQGSEL